MCAILIGSGSVIYCKYVQFSGIGTVNLVITFVQT